MRPEDESDYVEAEIVDDEIEFSKTDKIGVIDRGLLGVGPNPKLLPKILTLVAAASDNVLPIDDVFRKIGLRPKPYIEPRKCLNPDCQEYTDHKKGYCSKDCLEKHKLLTKGK